MTSKQKNLQDFLMTCYVTCFESKTQKVSILLAMFLFVALPIEVCAFRITEILYDSKGSDAGYEWIEVLNNGTTTIDISTFKLFEGGTNHKLSVSQGDPHIPVGGVAVIADNPAKFLEINSTFSGVLLNSSFGLSNTGETLSLKNSNDKADDTVSYTAKKDADGTGLSIARGESGPFVAIIPTPGVFDPSPRKATLAKEQKEETQGISVTLQKKARAPEVKGAEIALEESSQNTVQVSSLDPKDSHAKSSPMLLYVLGALGVCVLGISCAFALKYMHTSVSKEEQELQKLVDSFEIIE